MTILNIEDSLVLIIDVQEKLLNATFNKSLLERKAEIIAKAASILNIPIYITEQYPKGLGSTINGIKNSINNSVKYYEKISFSALDDEILKEEIRKENKKQIIIFGIETHICVNQTVNALLDMDYEVNVISDACGSRSEMEYSAGLSRMKDNGAHIITTEIALFEWLKSAKHEKFKEIQNLIK